MARPTNIEQAADAIVSAFQSSRKGGNNAMSRAINSDAYKKLANAPGGGGLKALSDEVLKRLGPTSQDGKDFSRLLKEHQDAKTGGTFAEQLSKALRGTPVKKTAQTAAKTARKGGPAQSYGRKMYNKMSPDQQRALQAATQGEQSSILDAVLDKTDKTDFDNFLASMDQNNGTNYSPSQEPAKATANNTPKQSELPDTSKKHQSWAIASFSIGIASIFLSFIGLLPIIEIFVSLRALYLTKGNGLAIAGLIPNSLYTLVYMQLYGHISWFG